VLSNRYLFEFMIWMRIREQNKKNHTSHRLMVVTVRNSFWQLHTYFFLCVTMHSGNRSSLQMIFFLILRWYALPSYLYCIFLTFIFLI